VAPDFQPPPAADAAKSPEVRLLRVRLDRVRGEMTRLDVDESKLAFWGKMSPRLVHAVLESGRANRATLRRLKRALRWAWTDKVGIDADEEHWSRVTMKYLSEDIS
jgi:hypothetical protein